MSNESNVNCRFLLTIKELIAGTFEKKLVRYYHARNQNGLLLLHKLVVEQIFACYGLGNYNFAKERIGKTLSQKPIARFVVKTKPTAWI